MPYLPPYMRRKESTFLIHILDSEYEPDRIEKLKKNIWVKEDHKKNEITLTTNQWKNVARLGRIYRKESVTVIPSDSDYIPKSAIITYGYFHSENTKEHIGKLLNNFVEETNKSIGPGVVKIIRSSDNRVIGFKVDGGWEELPCFIRELDKEIYGADLRIELYGI